MLINVLAWLFTPPKKSRGRSGAMIGCCAGFCWPFSFYGG